MLSKYKVIHNIQINLSLSITKMIIIIMIYSYQKVTLGSLYQKHHKKINNNPYLQNNNKNINKKKQNLPKLDLQSIHNKIKIKMKIKHQ